jgi:hypothetical protein
MEIEVKDQLLWMSELIFPDWGIAQHSDGNIPNKEYYGSVDDNARTISLLSQFSETYRDIEGLRTCFDYVKRAFEHGPQGFPANYRDSSGQFNGRDGQPDTAIQLQDCYGRSLQALVDLSSSQCDQHMKQEALTLFNEKKGKSTRELTSSNSLSLTAIAYATFLRNNLAQDLHCHLKDTINELVTRHRKWSDESFQGFSDSYTYCATLPIEALLRSVPFRDDMEAIHRGRDSLDFLGQHLINDNTFYPIGTAGWFPKGGIPARYSQQGIEAAKFTECCVLAYHVFKDEKYKRWAIVSYRWFKGNNSDKVSLLGPNGEVFDGVDEGGRLNTNCGAESVIAYLKAANALQRIE